VARHRAIRILLVTQSLEAAGALAIGIPLLTGWMSIWYLVSLSYAIGCILAVDLPARQTFMLDLTGPAELRRGASLFATVTGLARMAVRGDEPAHRHPALLSRLGRLRAVRHVRGGRRDRRELLVLAPRGPRPA
jgi:hypothetical protein